MIKERNSNIELLRILSMFMIVISHYSVHGGGTLLNHPLVNKIILDNFVLGNIGVIIFSIITGYFFSHINYDFKKVIKIIFKTFFYSSIIGILFYIFNIYNINVSFFGLIRSIFPVMFGEYWFITSYVILFLLVPYINKLLQSLTEKEFMSLLLVLFVLFYFFPTFTNYNLTNLVYVLFGYIIGFFLNIYTDNKYLKKINFKVLLLVSWLFVIFITIVLNLLSYKIPMISSFTSYFYGISKIPVIFISISLFMIFKNLKINNNKIINYISGSTLAVYLISDNKYIRQLLWLNIFKQLVISNPIIFIAYSLSCVLLVYVICTIIDILYREIIEKHIVKHIYNLINYCCNTTNKFIVKE